MLQSCGWICLNTFDVEMLIYKCIACCNEQVASVLTLAMIASCLISWNERIIEPITIFGLENVVKNEAVELLR